MMIKDVGPGDVNDYLKNIARTVGPASSKSGRALLNKTFGAAVLTGYIDRNPARDARTIRVQKAQHTGTAHLDHHRALSPEERLDLAWAVSRNERAKNMDDRDLILTGLALGGRIGELMALAGQTSN